MTAVDDQNDELTLCSFLLSHFKERASHFMFNLIKITPLRKAKHARNRAEMR